MALTAYTMLELGTKAPDFNLLNTLTGNILSYDKARGVKGTVIMFICNHCPYVLHVNEELIRVAHDYRVLGFGFVAISSNDVTNYPQDSPALMREQGDKLDYPFPYLYDETQEVARAYSAACTPDIFVFDGGDRLVYRGQLDDSRPGNGISLTGRSLREALDALQNNKTVSSIQKPSVGCGIKWK